MPYLEFLFCDTCGDMSNLDVDYLATVEMYIKDNKKNPFIDQATVMWNNIVYYCPVCYRRYIYTYRDVEKKVREYLIRVSEQYRKYFEDMGIDISSIDIVEEIKKTLPAVEINQLKKHTKERVLKLYTSNNV